MPQTHVVRLPNLVEVDAIDKVCGQLEPPRARERAARIVYLGQLLPAKGLRELVTACARLAAGGLRLDLVGPVESRFRQELSRLAGPGAGWLQFHGPVAHDRSLAHLAAADVFVLPSYSEGFPNAVLEAMVCQRPILATSVGAIPEMLDCGGREECGVCVPPRDVAALTRELQRLLADEAARRQLGMRARRRAERLYAAPVVSGDLLRLWQQVGRPAEPCVARAA